MKNLSNEEINIVAGGGLDPLKQQERRNEIILRLARDTALEDSVNEAFLASVELRPELFESLSKKKLNIPQPESSA